MVEVTEIYPLEDYKLWRVQFIRYPYIPDSTRLSYKFIFAEDEVGALIIFMGKNNF